MWLIPTIALLFMCYLLWLFGKLWRLSKRKARFRSASVARQRRQPPSPGPVEKDIGRSEHVRADDCLGFGLIQKYNYSGRVIPHTPRRWSLTSATTKRRFNSPLRATLSGRCRCTCISLSAISCFCGCNKLVTRQTHKADEYLNVLAQEIASRAPLFAGRKVGQMHWGGGTPTYLIKRKSAGWWRCCANTLISCPMRRCRSRSIRVR